MSKIIALRGLRQEDYKCNTKLGYIVWPCLNNNKTSAEFLYQVLRSIIGKEARKDIRS